MILPLWWYQVFVSCKCLGRHCVVIVNYELKPSHLGVLFLRSWQSPKPCGQGLAFLVPFV